MWAVMWDVVAIAILAGVALLFIVDALSERTVWARAAAFVAIAAGIVAGLELGSPWLPLGLLVAAFALWVTGRRSEAPKHHSTRARA